MALLLRKLFRIGKLPEELRVGLEAEGIVHLAEFVPVTRRFTGSIPGKRATGSVSSYTGALVLTHRRVLATLSTVPKLAGRTIDQPFDAPAAGPVTAELSATGLRIEVDVSAVDPGAKANCPCTTRPTSPRASCSACPPGSSPTAFRPSGCSAPSV